MIELYLIRHGETDYNKDHRFMGVTDISLNETGRKQAKTLKYKIRRRSLKFDFVFVSPLKRCRETAEIIGLENQSVIETDLREANYGAAEGLTYEELKEKYPGQCELREKDLINHIIPGGESYAQMYERVSGCIEKLLEGKENQKGAIIAHGGTVMAILSHYLYNSSEGLVHFFIRNARMVELCIPTRETAFLRL